MTGAVTLAAMSLIRSWAARAYRHFSPPAVDGWYRRIHLDYPVKPQPRWGQDGKPTHAKLAEIIERVARSTRRRSTECSRTRTLSSRST